MDDPRFPIGEFRYDPSDDSEGPEHWLAENETAPARLRAAVAGLDPHQLETPYRAGGWTVRQVVHHLPDSHFNSYCRFKLALTEDTPTIRPYLEARWAELPDGRSAPVELSVALLEALHARWMLLLRTLGPADLDRRFIHPEHGETFDLRRTLAFYAWHGSHHVAHITALRAREGW